MAKKKKKDAQAGAESSAGSHELRLGDHPRAQRQIRRAKASGGLVAFVLTLWLSHSAGLPLDHMLERALIAAVCGYVLLWAIAVLVWRQLAAAEIEAARVKIVEHLQAMHAEHDAGDHA